MLRASVVLAAFFVGACRDGGDPGFEVVKVPMSAYAAPDAAKDGAALASTDAGRDPVVLCVPKPEVDKDKDEESSDDCPSEYQGRAYDEKATTRHRAKDDESTVCCYRKGRVVHRATEDVE